MAGRKRRANPFWTTVTTWTRGPHSAGNAQVEDIYVYHHSWTTSSSQREISSGRFPPRGPTFKRPASHPGPTFSTFEYYTTPPLFPLFHLFFPYIIFPFFSSSFYTFHNINLYIPFSILSNMYFNISIYISLILVSMNKQI